MDLSVVVPLHNEEDNVERLLDVVPASLDHIALVDRFEIVCVDDGSRDRTAEALEQHRTEHTRIVTLPTRHGQSAATAAGIGAARYDVIGRLDGDLQTDPDDFEPLLTALAEGHDCAHGVRLDRQDSPVRRWSSVIANAARRAFLGDRFRDVSCPLTVFRKACLEHVPTFDSLHRYLPYLIEMQGYRVTEVPVRHLPRIAGRSKYGVWNRLGVGVRSLFLVRRLARELSGRATQR
jgi:glycosyltransferase involved in cell wall biosynthesis